MGVETSTDHGGAGMSFTSAIVAIEGESKSPFNPLLPSPSRESDGSKADRVLLRARMFFRTCQGRPQCVGLHGRTKHPRQHPPQKLRRQGTSGQVPPPTGREEGTERFPWIDRRKIVTRKIRKSMADGGLRALFSLDGIFLPFGTRFRIGRFRTSDEGREEGWRIHHQRKQDVVRDSAFAHAPKRQSAMIDLVGLRY